MKFSNICKTFSVDNKNQEKNLIETIKQNCRRIVREKTGKKPYTNINITSLMGIWISNLCNDLVDNLFSVLPVGIKSKNETFKEKIEGIL